jgi:putative spermidine/putrescine transport system permease protein
VVQRLGLTELVTATLEAAVPPRPSPGRRLPRLPGAGLFPFAAYFIIFLGVPTVAVLYGAFEGPNGGFTLHNLHIAFSGNYLTGYEHTLKLSAITAVIPGILGFLIAYAVHTAPDGNWLRRVVSSASGVFANFGGVPLAFLFTATFGPSAIATSYLNHVGIDISNFNVHGMGGIELVYCYFQIPLMVLVITPALGALKPAWQEASDNLGASSWEFWRLVGGPVLFPAFLGGVLLLFGSAMSAYATADALTGGAISITSIQIASFLNGNVLAGQENVGKALGLGLVIIIAVVMVLYGLIQRRASRWLR